MKTFLFVSLLILTFNLNAQLYSPNKTIANTSEKALAEYLTSNFDELNLPDISTKLIFQKSTAHANYFTFSILYKNIELFNNSIKLCIDKNNKIISVKKELNDFNGLTNFLITKNVDDWNCKQAILSTWKDEKLVQSKELKIMFENNLPQLILQINAWNKSLDQSILVDETGTIIQKIDYARHLVKDTIISAKVFNPDPLTTLNKTYGGIYIDNNDANDSWMNSVYFSVNIPARFDDVSNVFLLENGLVKIDDFESPTVAPTTSTTPNFIFNRNQSGFEECNIMYHINQFHNYIALYGYDTLLKNGITVDAHGQFGTDNSVFKRNGGNPTLSFGTGGVDDAEDADVIIHEYSHGLSWDANGNDNFSNERAGLDEGLADYFATSYSRQLNTYNWQNMFSWDGHNTFWDGRIANTTNNYGSTNDMYKMGEIWNSAMTGIWLDVGDVLTNLLMLESMHFFTNNTTLPEAAIYVLKADTLLFNGVNSPLICAHFQARNILGNNCMPVSIQQIDENNLVQISNSIGFAKGENPLSISFNKIEKGNLSISDMTGKIIYHEAFLTQHISVAPNQFHSGIYLLTIKIGSETQTIKIAKW